jgi:hypothetical protein
MPYGLIGRDVRPPPSFELSPVEFDGWTETWLPVGASAYHGAPKAVTPWPSVSPGFSSPS